MSRKDVAIRLQQGHLLADIYASIEGIRGHVEEDESESDAPVIREDFRVMLEVLTIFIRRCINEIPTEPRIIMRQPLHYCPIYVKQARRPIKRIPQRSNNQSRQLCGVTNRSNKK